MKEKELTPDQLRAMKFIEQYGSIDRYEGGFWSKPDAELDGFIPKESAGRAEKDCHFPKDYVGTNTIYALEKRGLIRISKMKESRTGFFAIQYKKV